jgi:hypothetical protein
LGGDIWCHPKGKVLNVIWNEPDRQRKIVTFRRVPPIHSVYENSCGIGDHAA